MPIYTYRCPDCGPFEYFRPVAERATRVPCPSCRVTSSRMLDSPHLTRTPSALGRAAEAAGRSAESPDVATRASQPPGRTGSDSGQRRRYPPLPRT